MYMDADFLLDVLGVVLALGASFYLFQIVRVLKGGILEKGMTLIAASPVLVALSALFEALFEMGYGDLYNGVHDVFRLAFIIVLLLGARSIVLTWRKKAR